jgi:hypothetical protein
MVERGACATILMPGETMPMPEPGDSPGCAGGYTSIAGGGVVDEGQKTTKTQAHPVVKAISAPFAVLLFPFKLMAAGAGKLADLVNPKDEVPLDPRLRARRRRSQRPIRRHRTRSSSSPRSSARLEQRGGKTRSSSSGAQAAPPSARGHRRGRERGARAAAAVDRRRAGALRGGSARVAPEAGRARAPQRCRPRRPSPSRSRRRPRAHPPPARPTAC